MKLKVGILYRKFLLLMFIISLSGCSIVYLKASEFKLRDYIVEPKIGSIFEFKNEKLFPIEVLVVYELNKKKSKYITIRVENYKSGDSTLYISYLYDSLKVNDDYVSDTEMFPVVTNERKKIIGYGWHFVDSLKQIKFLDRMKKIDK
jgi:hypothetical protein